MPSKLLSAGLLTLTLTLTLTITTLTAAEYLSAVDFGFKLTDHGRVDLSCIPPGVAPGNFNHDDYMDVARFQGKCLEIYISQGWGYPVEPSYEKYYSVPITAITTEGEIWIDAWDIVVTLADGCEERIENHGGNLQIDAEPNLFEKYSSSPPPRISEADFQLVWESGTYLDGGNDNAVGDIDNDGIIELCTWWKPYGGADSAFILIYKNTGDDEYELFMEEPVIVSYPHDPTVTNMVITDIDQNGQKELMYTLEYTHFWEFTGVGEYRYRQSNYPFERGVKDIVICDLDLDGVLEYAAVTGNTIITPPCIYRAFEFTSKNNTFNFICIFTSTQNWIDSHLEVGDFDNDGVVDIVSGNAGSVFPGETIDIQYFRYDTTVSNPNTPFWLETGIGASCCVPQIADFDLDDDLELLALGKYPSGGSAFLWEATGVNQGYASWIDTVSLFSNVDYATYCLIDYMPSVFAISDFTLSGVLTSQISTFSFSGNQATAIWTSAWQDSIFYHGPCASDMDGDGKTDLLATAIQWGTSIQHLDIWEQISAGAGGFEHPEPLGAFKLHPNYPNPINAQTTIPFTLNRAGKVKIEIFDITGRSVGAKGLSPLQTWYSAGSHEFVWNAEGMASGVYLVRLELQSAGTLQHKVRKVVLLK